MEHSLTELTQRLHLQPRHAEDQRQIVRCVGKRNPGIFAFFRQGALQHHVRFSDECVRPSDRPSRDITRHDQFPPVGSTGTP